MSDRDQFVDQVSRSARLYQRGLITAQEFTNVTLEDLRKIDARERAPYDKHHLYGLDHEDLWDANQFVQDWRDSDNCDDTPAHRERLTQLARRLRKASNEMCLNRT